MFQTLTLRTIQGLIVCLSGRNGLGLRGHYPLSRQWVPGLEEYGEMRQIDHNVAIGDCNTVRSSNELSLPCVAQPSTVHQGSNRMVPTGRGKGLKQDLNHLWAWKQDRRLHWHLSGYQWPQTTRCHRRPMVIRERLAGAVREVMNGPNYISHWMVEQVIRVGKLRLGVRPHSHLATRVCQQTPASSHTLSSPLHGSECLEQNGKGML